MPTLFLALTIVSGLSFAASLGWVILQWVRADRDFAASEKAAEPRLQGASDPSA